MNKIAIVTCLHKRPALTRIILAYYKRLQARIPGLILVACGSSPEDEEIARENGWEYCHAENIPLSFKHTDLFLFARMFCPDGCILIGSDDLLSEALIRWYMANAKPEQIQLWGLSDIYFYQAKTARTIHHLGFLAKNVGFTIGCGRLFSKGLLDRIDWKPWGPPYRLNRGLDLTCSRYLRDKGLSEVKHYMKDIGIMVDIKTEQNLTNMDTFNFNFNEVSQSVLFPTFEREINEIKAVIQ